jgi:aminoglycoside phosphotransferase (APT) family kinase protein
LDSPVIPEEVYPALQAVVGAPVVAEHVRMGVGGPGIVVCRGPDGRAVFKRTSADEASFYREWAPILAERGLRVPKAFAQGTAATGPWIVLEWLPRVLDGHDPAWVPEQTRYLAQLHRLLPEAAPSAASLLPRRDSQLTGSDADDALALWEPGPARRLRCLLSEPWPYVEGRQLVSGDPNPTNWGWRQSGELVLFDWAEAGWGHPSYDLPILCRGLPDGAAIRRVVVPYLAAGNVGDPEVVDQWVAWALTGRLVTFLRFLAGWRRGQVTEAARRGVDMLRDGLLDWVQAVRPLALPFARRPLVTPD